MKKSIVNVKDYSQVVRFDKSSYQLILINKSYKAEKIKS